jgi:hypothetical protein
MSKTLKFAKVEALLQDKACKIGRVFQNRDSVQYIECFTEAGIPFFIHIDGYLIVPLKSERAVHIEDCQDSYIAESIPVSKPNDINVLIISRSRILHGEKYYIMPSKPNIDKITDLTKEADDAKLTKNETKEKAREDTLGGAVYFCMTIKEVGAYRESISRHVGEKNDRIRSFREDSRAALEKSVGEMLDKAQTSIKNQTIAFKQHERTLNSNIAKADAILARASDPKHITKIKDTSASMYAELLRKSDEYETRLQDYAFVLKRIIDR